MAAPKQKRIDAGYWRKTLPGRCPWFIPGNEYVIEYRTRIKNRKLNPVESKSDMGEYDNRFWGWTLACEPPNEEYPNELLKGTIARKLPEEEFDSRVFGRSRHPVETSEKQGFLTNYVHHPCGPADPEHVKWTRDQFDRGKSIMAYAAQHYMDGDPADGWCLAEGYLKEKLAEWSKHDKRWIYEDIFESYYADNRFEYFCHNRGLFDPVEPLLNRITVLYTKKRDDRIEEKKKAREAKSPKPIYPVKIDVDELACRPVIRNTIMSKIKRRLLARRLYDIPKADTEQIAGNVICEFLRAAKAGEIEAAHGVPSYVDWIKTTAWNMAGRLCTETNLERRFHADPVEMEGDEYGFREEWIDTLEDSEWAGRRGQIQKGGLFVPDSHRYGQNPEEDYEVGFEDEMTPAEKKDEFWVLVWFYSTARGDTRPDEYDYALFERVLGLKKNQVKKGLQTGKRKYAEMVRKIGKRRMPASREGQYETGFRFLVGYGAPKEMISADTIPSEWGKPSLPPAHYVRSPHRVPAFHPRKYVPLQCYWNEKFDCLMPPVDQSILANEFGEPNLYWFEYKQMHRGGLDEVF